MIAPDSASYPILGAARACGVDYGVALGLYWFARTHGATAICSVGAPWTEGVGRLGEAAMHDIARRLDAAVAEGRLVIRKACA